MWFIYFYHQVKVIKQHISHAMLQVQYNRWPNQCLLVFPKKIKSKFTPYLYMVSSCVFLFLFFFWAGRGETQCLLVSPKKINVYSVLTHGIWFFLSFFFFFGRPPGGGGGGGCVKRERERERSKICALFLLRILVVGWHVS